MAEIVDDASWASARLELLAAEKELQRLRDEVAAKRRKLPARKIDSAYVFEGPRGAAPLADLFGECSQLIVYHFMYHPDWEAGCKSCSFWADSYDGVIAHLAARDVGFAAISRAPLETLLAYQQRMGWSFAWYSSADSSFNYDFGVSFTQDEIDAGSGNYNYTEGAGRIEELPGLSVFRKGGDGSILHTYSTFSRGLDPLNPVYQMLDLVPKGRDEDGLPYPMDWVRRHDEY